MRNRERILEAAEVTFAARGIAVPISEIARRAGLGVGTLYRHFPTKEALWEAIAHLRLEQVLEDVRQRANAADPGEALFEVVSDLVEHSETKRDLFEALAGAGVDPKARFEHAFASLHEAVGVLLARAQAAGSIRSDVGVDDLFALVGGACAACSEGGFHDASPRRLLGVILDGLRVRHERPGSGHRAQAER